MQSTCYDQVVDMVKAKKHRVFFVRVVVVVVTSYLIQNFLIVEVEVEVVPVFECEARDEFSYYLSVYLSVAVRVILITRVIYLAFS